MDDTPTTPEDCYNLMLVMGQSVAAYRGPGKKVVQSKGARKCLKTGCLERRAAGTLLHSI